MKVMPTITLAIAIASSNAAATNDAKVSVADRELVVLALRETPPTITPPLQEARAEAAIEAKSLLQAPSSVALRQRDVAEAPPPPKTVAEARERKRDVQDQPILTDHSF